jgi:hypothetical protein
MQYVDAPNYRALPALELFRMGFDTSAIAALKGTDEGYIYNLLHRSREAERKSAEYLKQLD